MTHWLLTGTTPFQDADLRRAGFDEQRRIIREQEPPRASVRISSLGETATSVAEQRKTDAKRLHHQVRGDLDWIVLKALEKDRTRRYDTAADFAQDVERHVANEPVIACPPSLAYRARKCWRRNRFILTTTLLIAAALSIGVTLTVWKTYESMKHLKAFRDLAFKRTMNAAILGDRDFLEAFAQAEDVSIPQEWRYFFQGLVHFYDGHANDAIKDFEQSLEIEENNMAACALLALCFVSTHEWDRFFAYRDRLDSMVPRPGYEEYDRFFDSLYGTYRGSDGVDVLRTFLTQHPNSALARVYYANCCFASASMLGDLELARLNVDRNVVVIEELWGDNPQAQAACLLSYATFIQLAEESNEPTSAVRARADKLAASMHAEHFGTTHFARAYYYEVLGKYDEALASWQAAAKMGIFGPYYIAEGIRLGKNREVADFLRNQSQTQKGSKDAGIPWWEESGDGKDRVVQDPDYDGFDVVLYVGDHATARASSGVETREGMYVKLSVALIYPRRMKEFLQGTIGEKELIADAGTSRADLAKTYYVIGLDHMANGRSAAAKENLARVVDLGQIWLPFHYIARLFCERIEDP